jgi:hypothetical protein
MAFCCTHLLGVGMLLRFQFHLVEQYVQIYRIRLPDLGRISHPTYSIC